MHENVILLIKLILKQQQKNEHSEYHDSLQVDSLFFQFKEEGIYFKVQPLVKALNCKSKDCRT